MPRPGRPTHNKHLTLPSDELVLAAVERAARHQARDTPAVPVWAIVEHLAIRRRSAAARHVRERLLAMCEAGLLERGQRHSVPTWSLTGAGTARLRAARSASTLPPLPESPQHRDWRNAHTAAVLEIARFRDSVRERLTRTAQLLDAEPPPDSDVWLELAEELQRGCRRLASATHCLHEWAEPDDGRADVDDRSESTDAVLDSRERARRRARRAGRRNVRLWDDGPAS